MLVLSRFAGETIYIGDNISITVGHVGAKGKVRLQIDAPRDVVVLRGELLDGTKGVGGFRFGKGPAAAADAELAGEGEIPPAE